MEQPLIDNLRRPAAWRRLLLMIVFLIAYAVTEWLLIAIVAFQALYILFLGKPNRPLQRFGVSLGDYIRDVVRFLTAHSERAPFPFADWPSARPSTSDAAAVDPSR